MAAGAMENTYALVCFGVHGGRFEPVGNYRRLSVKADDYSKGQFTSIAHGKAARARIRSWGVVANAEIEYSVDGQLEVGDALRRVEGIVHAPALDHGVSGAAELGFRVVDIHPPRQGQRLVRIGSDEDQD